jgi:cell division protein FtsZ
MKDCSVSLIRNITAFAAFDKPNEVLYEATRGIADIITVEGLINVDFADVRAVMSQSGEALMGCGIASGENRAIEAAQKAISSPLCLKVSALKVLKVFCLMLPVQAILQCRK